MQVKKGCNVIKSLLSWNICWHLFHYLRLFQNFGHLDYKVSRPLGHLEWRGSSNCYGKYAFGRLQRAITLFLVAISQKFFLLQNRDQLKLKIWNFGACRSFVSKNFIFPYPLGLLKFQQFLNLPLSAFIYVAPLKTLSEQFQSCFYFNCSGSYDVL